MGSKVTEKFFLGGGGIPKRSNLAQNQGFFTFKENEIISFVWK